jgi:hypothetical protein
VKALWRWLQLSPGGALLLLGTLLLPPLAVQLGAPVPRLDADAVEYFSHVRSLYLDHDLDFANEFEHFGILSRYDKIRPTPTGHRRTIFSVGPALLWMPFYAAGDAWARWRGTVEDGYSPAHIRAVCLASLFYGFLGLVLVHRVLRDLVPPAVAFCTVFLLLYATFLYWYMVQEAVMSHALSFAVAAAVLAVWWDGRQQLHVGRGAALGLLIGLAATVRWQNGLLLLLPAATLLSGLRSQPRTGVLCGAVVLGAFTLGAFPQLLAWKAIFGTYLLADPPHGRDFLRLGHPYLLNTFFSSRHGLLYWTPVLWGGFLGLALLFRRDRRLALMVLALLAAMSYVNVCSGDWWAGGSFSNRRFDSALPLLAIGLALCLAALARACTRRPAAVIVLAGLVLAGWNLLLMQLYRDNRIPRDDTVAFPRIAEGNADSLAGLVGTPLAWPANWVFAREHHAAADQYDLAVGKYLFYRQNNLDGVIDLGDERADPALLAEGWTPRQACGQDVCRGVAGRARLFVPLDVAEDLDLTLRAQGRGTLALEVNGRPVAELPLAATLSEARLRIGAASWRRELNELVLSLSAGGEASVDRLVFERVGR